MKIKVIVLLLVIVASGLYLAHVIRSRSMESRVRNSSVVRSNPYFCSACETMSEIDFDTVRKLKKQGKTIEPSATSRRKYPCPKCGQVEATYYEDKYDVPEQ